MLQDSDLDPFRRPDAGSDEPAAASVGSSPTQAPSSRKYNFDAITPEIADAFKAAAQAYGVDENVLIGIAAQESGFNPKAIGPVTSSGQRAVGLMQFMPDTAKRYGIDPTDPIESIVGAAAYMRNSLDKFGGDYRKAIASYNWGENRKAFDAPDWEKSLPPETKDYLGYVSQFMNLEAERNPRQELPAGVKPSEAGGGRGFVNPPMVDDADLSKPFIGFQGPTGGKVAPRSVEQSEAMKGLQSGAIGLKQMWESNKVLVDSTAIQRQSEALALFDKADAGTSADDIKRTVRPGKTPTYAQERAIVYASANPQLRQQMRDAIEQDIAGRTAFVDASLATIRQYQADQQRVKGRVDEFTDIKSLKDFQDWLVFNGASGIVSMAPLLIAAATTGGAAPVVTGALGYGMATGELAGDRIKAGEGANAPGRFANPDRQDQATPAANAAARGYVAKTADSTYGAAAPFAALDVLLGPTAHVLARTLMKRAGQEPERLTVKGAIKETGKGTAEEFAAGGGQESIKIGAEVGLGEQENFATPENAKRIFNSAMAEAAGGLVGGAGVSGVRLAAQAPKTDAQKITDIGNAKTMDDVAAAAMASVQAPPSSPPAQAAADNLAGLIQDRIIGKTSPDIAATTDAITALETQNAGTAGNAGVVDSGATAGPGDQAVGGVGAAGLGDAVRGASGGNPEVAVAGVGRAESVPQPNGERPAGVEPAKVWYGRRGDGYLTPEDAQRGLGERQRLQGQLNWKIEPTPDGKYRLAGYAPSTAGGTVQASAPAYQSINQAPITFSQGKGGSWFVGGDPATVRDLLKANGIANFIPTRGGAQLPASTDPEVIGAIRMMAEDIKNLSHQELKDEIRQRMGLDQPTEKSPAGSPFRSFLRNFGIKPELRADITGESNGFRANARLPKTFRADGLNIDELAQRAVEYGFMRQSELDNPNDNGGANRLIAMIQAEIRGVRQMTVEDMNESDPAEEAAQADVMGRLDRMGVPVSVYRDMTPAQMDRLAKRIGKRLERARLNRQAIEVAEEARIEREAIIWADALPLQAQDDRLPSVITTVGNNATLEQAMRALLFTEQEIQDALAKEASAAQRAEADGPIEPEGPGRSAQAGGRDSDREGPRAEGQAEAGLTAPTPEDIIAQQERAEQGEKDEQQAKAAEQARIRKAEQDKENKTRADATVDDFQLGQSADRQMSGVRDMFDAPAAASAPTRKENPTSLSTSDGRGKEAAGSERVADQQPAPGDPQAQEGSTGEPQAPASATKDAQQTASAPVSSREGQMNLAARAGRIATLKQMNDRLRSIAPSEAWANTNIESASNAELDKLQDQISAALVAAQRGPSAVNPLRAELEAMSGAELRELMDRMGLAGKLMTASERVDALLAEDLAEVRAAMQPKAPSEPVQEGGAIDQNSNLPDGTTIKDGNGNLYRVHYQRNGLVIAHPILDGKPVVSKDTSVRFWVDNRGGTPSGDSDRTDPIYRAQATGEAAPGQENDRDSFTLQRLNRETDKMESITFRRGEYVTFKVGEGGKQAFGEIDGISHAKREFSVDGLWYDFGFAYKAERPAPAKKDTVPMSTVVDAVNKKHGGGLGPADAVSIVDAFKGTMRAVYDGTASIDDYKTAYGKVRDAEKTKAELGKMTKDELIRTFGIMVRPDEKKDGLVATAYKSMLRSFALGKEYGSRTYLMTRGGLENYERQQAEALDAIVANHTADDLAAFAAEVKAAREERDAKRSAAVEAIKNPKTLDEYRQFMSYHTRDGKSTAEVRLTMLKPEQRAEFDLMLAEESRGRRKVNADEQRTQVRVAGQTVDGNIIATKHTKKGHDLFVVQLSERVSREDYETLNTGAKKIGGYYSSFRGGGAIPGFQFTTREQAQAFVTLAGGDATAAKEAAQERRDAYADDRSQTAAERLTEMANAIEEAADESLNRERKANTARRARFAAAAEAGAREAKAMAKTMRNVAEALTNGSAKFLDRIRTKKQVELLQTYVANAKDAELRAKYQTYAEQEKRKGQPPTQETADYAEFPEYTAYRSDLASLGRQLQEVDGTKKLGDRLMKVADDVSDAFTAWAKEPGNLFKLSTFSVRSGEDVKTAIFRDRETAERAIKRSGLSGKAIVFPEKRGVNRIIMSPSEAIAKGIWTGDGDKRITLNEAFGAEIVEGIGRAAKRGSRVNDRLNAPWQFERAYERRKQLASMGIETPAEFRSALREFIGLREQAAEADKIKAMERAMIGRAKDGLDFFPTPEAVADEMIAAADIRPDMAVLEPSAGIGHIADRIRSAGAEPDVIEMDVDRRELLQEKGYHLAPVNDFLQLEPRKFFTYGDVFRAPDGTEGVMTGLGSMGSRRVVLKPLVNGEEIDYRRGEWYDRDELVGVRHRGVDSGYDRIIMNPPFSNGRDIEHVRHAYTLLKPGGRLVALMGESAFTNQNKRATEFREWLENLGGTEEKLPDGSFMDPSLPVNTGANARMVVIEKDSSAPAFSRNPFYSSLRQSIEKINAEGQTGGMSIEAARKIIDAKTAKWANGPRVVVVATARDLPMAAPDDANGVYHQGTVYIVAGAHRSPGQVLRTLAHEAVAHYGLRGMLGDGYKTFLKQMQLAIKLGNKPLIAIRDDVRSRYDGLTELQEADEIAARAIEQGIDPKTGEFKPGFGWLKSWFAKIAQFLRTELGILIPVTNLELQGMLVNAQRFVQGSSAEAVQGDAVPAFAKGGATPQGTSNDPTAPDSGGAFASDLQARLFFVAGKYGTGKPSKDTAVADAVEVMGFDLAPMVIHESRPDLPATPMRYVTGSETINYNTAVSRTRAADVQYMIEELLHSFDHVGEGKSISASSSRLAAGGDLRVELESAYAASAAMKDVFDHPLDEPEMTETEIAAELYARSGMLYYSNPELLRLTAPKTYETHQRAFAGTTSQNRLSGPVRGLRHTGVQTGQPIGRGPGVSSPPAKRVGQQYADGLQRLRQGIADAFGGRIEGSAIQFHGTDDSLNSAAPGRSTTDDDIAFSRGGEADPVIEPTRDIKSDGPGMRWIGEEGRYQFAPGAWLWDVLGKKAGPLLAWAQLKSPNKELREIMREMKLKVQQAQDTAVDVAKAAAQLSDTEREMVSDIIERELKTGTVPPEHAVRLAATMNAAMNRQTDELIELGMLSRESADIWRGQYLPRFYEGKLAPGMPEPWAKAMRKLRGNPNALKGMKGNHLRGRGMYEVINESDLPSWEKMGWQVRDPGYNPSIPTEDGKVQVWRDYTRQERDKMGEIRDAGFRFVMGYMQMQKDIALGRMFERIASDPEMSSRLPSGDMTVQVPSKKIAGTGVEVYGKLAGRYVSKETLSQLTGIEESHSDAWTMYRKALGIWKEGKALALNTPIPTPDGWTTMGEIKPGDTVFDEQGKPCLVIYATGVQLDRECFEVEFSDGCKIVADAEHLWFTNYHRKGSVKTTRQILDTLKERTRGDNNHSIPVAGPLDLPEQWLPVPPYALGAWLGDGRTDGVEMCAGSKDAEQMMQLIREAGLVTGAPYVDKRNGVVTWGLRYADASLPRKEGLQPTMRAMGLLGNKHIPAAYLRASEAQRRELLCGLMDTDGHVTEEGKCEFATTLPRLRDDIMELLRSLGYKPVAGQYVARVGGKNCGDHWRVKFQAYADKPCFKMVRKVARLRQAPETRQRSGTRQIVAIRPVQSVPVKCIQVDSESRLYLAGDGMIPTHNTALNPVAHANNIISNVSMAHFAGVSMHRPDKYLAAMRDFASKSTKIKEAKDAGLFLGTISEAELYNALPKELQELANRAESVAEKVGGTALNLLSFYLRKPMGWAYQAEDTFFRYLIYRDARERGMEPSDAVDYAQRYIFTYDDLPQTARRIRDFGIPFFAYTYKAVPALLHTALHHPDRMVLPAAVLWGVNAAAYAIAAGDDDESWDIKLKRYLTDPDYREKARKLEQMEREHLPIWQKGMTALGTPKTIRLGMDDVTKLPIFLDASRIVPGGDMLDVENNAGGVPWIQPLTPNHPLLSIYSAMMLNKDGYFGRELVDANDTRSEAAAKRADWMWKQLTPAIAFGNYHFERVMNAIAQATGEPVRWLPEMVSDNAVATGVARDGLPVQPKYAAMQTFGIKARPVDLESAEAIDESKKQQLIRGIDIEMKRLQRMTNKGAVADSVYESAAEKAQVKKDRLREGLTVDGDKR